MCWCLCPKWFKTRLQTSWLPKFSRIPVRRGEGQKDEEEGRERRGGGRVMAVGGGWTPLGNPKASSASSPEIWNIIPPTVITVTALYLWRVIRHHRKRWRHHFVRGGVYRFGLCGPALHCGCDRPLSNDCIPWLGRAWRRALGNNSLPDVGFSARQSRFSRRLRCARLVRRPVAMATGTEINRNYEAFLSKKNLSNLSVVARLHSTFCKAHGQRRLTMWNMCKTKEGKL